MKTTDELRHEGLTQRVEDYRTAYQDRDLERMLAMFADGAESPASRLAAAPARC